jgi:hypothetical protein
MEKNGGAVSFGQFTILLKIGISELLHPQQTKDTKRQLTLVLLHVGLDVETSAVCIAVLWFGQTSFNLAFCC